MAKTACVVIAILAAGCLGGGSKQQRGGADDDDIDEFKCNGRRAAYLLVGGFVAAEMGIQIQCAEDRPSLTKWTADESGEREEAKYPIGRDDFEQIWRAFADCLNSAAKDDDQIYTFDVADDDSQVAFTCQGKEQPFPFDRLVNALDIAAGAVE
jgi:hypothetical protein